MDRSRKRQAKRRVKQIRLNIQKVLKSRFFTRRLDSTRQAVERCEGCGRLAGFDGHVGKRETEARRPTTEHLGDQ